MAPTEQKTLQWETSEIIRCLFEDDEERKRTQLDGCVETDSPASFDPEAIANKLRSVADALNDDIVFQAALRDLKKAAAHEAAEAAFSHGVEALCQSQVVQTAELAPELQLIRASVALGLYIKKSSPELKSKVQDAMMTFINRHVGAWVAQQGGWVSVFSLF